MDKSDKTLSLHPLSKHLSEASSPALYQSSSTVRTVEQEDKNEDIDVSVWLKGMKNEAV